MKIRSSPLSRIRITLALAYTSVVSYSQVGVDSSGVPFRSNVLRWAVLDFNCAAIYYDSLIVLRTYSCEYERRLCMLREARGSVPVGVGWRIWMGRISAVTSLRS